MKTYQIRVTKSMDQVVDVEAETEEEAKEKAIWAVQDHIGQQGEDLWSDEEYVADIN